MAPYLFFIVGEAFNHVIKKVVTKGRFRGLTLPSGKNQHFIPQYANNSSFMVKDDKKDVDELVKLLRVLGEASSMDINWDKSRAH